MIQKIQFGKEEKNALVKLSLKTNGKKILHAQLAFVCVGITMMILGVVIFYPEQAMPQFFLMMGLGFLALYYGVFMKYIAKKKIMNKKYLEREYHYTKQEIKVISENDTTNYAWSDILWYQEIDDYIFFMANKKYIMVDKSKLSEDESLELAECMKALTSDKPNNN